MGGMSGLLGMLPQVSKAQRQMAESKMDDNMLSKQEAIVLSMTPRERQKPDIIKASRKRRISVGSGTTIQEVNRLLKQFKQMQGVMKRMGKLGKKGMMRGGMPGLMPPR